MTENIIVDLLALFIFAAVSVSAVFHWEKYISALKKHQIRLVVVISIACIISAWYFWAIYGVGLLVAQFDKAEIKIPSDNKSVASEVRKAPDKQQKEVSDPPMVATPDAQESRLSKAGQAGDMFGGFSALVTALTFGGAIGALVFQASAMRAAREQLKLQQFEPMFLFLLDQYKKMDSALQLKIDRHSLAPVELSAAAVAWRVYFDAFFNNRLALSSDHKQSPEYLRRVALFHSTRIYSHNSQQLGPLFRSLYHVFKAIKVSNLTHEQKTRYANIARLGLNEDHLFLMTLNGLTDAGHGFKPLIEEYGLLKHLFREPIKGVALARTPIQIIARFCYSRTATVTAARRERYWEKILISDLGRLSKHKLITEGSH